MQVFKWAMAAVASLVLLCGHAVAQTSTYAVTVKTGDVSGAGTDSNITLRLESSDGGQPVSVLLNPLLSGNAFERNDSNTVTFRGTTIRSINRITLSSDDAYPGSAWYVANVSVQAAETCGGVSPAGHCDYGQPQVFAFNTWLESPNLSRSAASTRETWQTRDARLGAARDAVTVAARDTEVTQLVANSTGLVRDCLNQALSTTGGWSVPNINVICDLSAPAPNVAERLRCYQEKLPAAGGSVAALQCLEQELDSTPEGQRYLQALTARLSPFNYQVDVRPPPPPGGETPEYLFNTSQKGMCYNALEGRVAWDLAGNKHWEEASKDRLCNGTNNATLRVACFRGQVASGQTWSAAADTCARDPNGARQLGERYTGPGGAPPPVAAVNPADVQQCKALTQDQIFWTMQNPADPATKHWEPGNLDSLCGQTKNPASTVRCFQDSLATNPRAGWSAAIAACQGK